MKKLQLLILFFLSFTFVQAQINANFSYTLGCGTSFNFTDESTSNGNISTWEWDFADGTTSTWQNPTHTYSMIGTYNVCLTVTDDLGETDTFCDAIAITNLGGPVCIIDPNIPVLTCNLGGNSTATLDGSLSSSGPNFTYLWTTQNGEILFGTEDVQSPIIGATGNYTLLVTDITNGCTASSTVTVTGDSDFPVANVQVSGVLSCSNPTVTLDGSGSTISSDFSFNWYLGNSVFSTNHTIDVSTAGTYEFRVSRVGMPWCSVSNFVEIESDGSGPSINLPVTPFNDTIYNCMETLFYSADLIDANCTNCSVEIRDANDTLLTTSLPWSFPAGTQQPLSIKITDNDSGCSNAIFLPVPQGNTSSFSVNKVDESCPGAADGSITPIFTGNSGPHTFDWLDLPGSDNPLNRTNLTAGVYELVITNSVGCQLFGFGPNGGIDIEIKSLPIANVNKTDNDLTCNSTPPFTLDGSFSSNGPNLIFEWFDINGNFIGNGEVLDVDDASIDYVLVVTDTNTGCQNSDTLTWIQGAIPIADAGPDQELSCVTAQVTLDGSNSSTGANITYEWSYNGTIIGTDITNNVLQPGVYTLTVFDANGCSSSDQVEVTSIATLPIFTAVAAVGCSGPFLTIDLDPSCVDCIVELYDNTGNQLSPCWNTPLCMLDPANGPYAVVVTDIYSGCSASELVNIIIVIAAPAEIESVEVTDVSCYGEANGSIFIDSITASPPYYFTWSTGDDTQGISNISAGTYYVTINDAIGCQVIDTFTVAEPDPIEITSAIITNATPGNADGAIDITLVGGTGPYTFEWSNFTFSEDINNLFPGSYNVTITDTNGCTTVSPDYDVQEDLIFNILFGLINDTTICMGESIQLADSIATGYSITWTPTVDLNDPNIPNALAAPTAATTYSYSISTPGGGTINGAGPTIEVQSYIDFGLLQFSNGPLCEGDTLELYGNLGLPNEFAWSGPNGFASTQQNPVIPNMTELFSGNYTVTVTDQFGCTAVGGSDVFIDDDCVWPGDTDTNMVVNHFDLLNIGLAFDSMGTIRQGASFDWMGQPSVDWTQSTPNSNVNYKHIDTDGNGVINSLDTLAITQNFGLTHNFNDPTILNQFNNLPPTSDGVLMAPFYVDPDTLIEGTTIGLDIILGDVGNVVMGLYGIGFSIEYDTAVIVPGSARIDFSNSWLGDINADAISIQFDFPSPGRIDAAITRIDGIEMDGFGLFGELIITLEDDILLHDPNGQVNFNPTDVTADFKITNYHLINFSEEEIIVDAVNTTAVVDGTTSLNKVELDELIELYPNPAKELFYVASKDLEVERIRIYAATGELIGLKNISKAVNEFSIKDLPSGIYFIEIQTEEGITTKKLNVMK